MQFPGSGNGWKVAYNHPIGSIYHLHTRYILPSRVLYNPYETPLIHSPEPARTGVPSMWLKGSQFPPTAPFRCWKMAGYQKETSCILEFPAEQLLIKSTST